MTKKSQVPAANQADNTLQHRQEAAHEFGIFPSAAQMNQQAKIAAAVKKTSSGKNKAKKTK